MSNTPRLTALVSRELLSPCYRKPQAGRVSPAHAQWVLAGKLYSWLWRDNALSLVLVSQYYQKQDEVLIGSDCIDSYFDALCAHQLLSDCSLIAL